MVKQSPTFYCSECNIIMTDSQVKFKEEHSDFYKKKYKNVLVCPYCVNQNRDKYIYKKAVIPETRLAKRIDGKVRLLQVEGLPPMHVFIQRKSSDTRDGLYGHVGNIAFQWQHSKIRYVDIGRIPSKLEADVAWEVVDIFFDHYMSLSNAHDTLHVVEGGDFNALSRLCS